MTTKHVTNGCKFRRCPQAPLVYTDIRYYELPDRVFYMVHCHAHASTLFGMLVPNGRLRADVKAVRIVDCEPRRAVTTEYGDWT